MKIHVNGVDLFFTGPKSKAKFASVIAQLNTITEKGWGANWKDTSPQGGSRKSCTIRFDMHSIEHTDLLVALQYNRMLANQAVQQANLVGLKYSCTGSEFYVMQTEKEDLVAAMNSEFSPVSV